MLPQSFFDQDAIKLAKALLGKIIRRRIHGVWLSMRIIETEAYYLVDKASHASLGFTEKRKALFMPAGTIYMYYAHGKASMNVSAQGAGNAVLIKSCFAHFDKKSPNDTQNIMQQWHAKKRSTQKLGNGQTIMCRSLQLTVPQWDQKTFDKKIFYIEDQNLKPQNIIIAKRLGIPLGRDEHLPYRFIDEEFNRFCTKPVNFTKL
ncbi:MAG: DNA-3-methyladenine glycosylase [Legionellales bacterium]|jgi:DNA-3-methyladenine glycosylase